MGTHVLAVGAHPDDLEWYAGGTIAKLAREGADIVLVICTDGGKGSFNPDEDSAQLAARRRIEQQNAADDLGIREVVFLDYFDGELESTPQLRKTLAALYRKHRPQILLAFDPWKRYELHPDHLAAGRAAVDARIAAKMPLFRSDEHARDLAAWAIGEVWLFNADTPNHFVDVSTTLDAQLHALELHRSQTTVWDDAAREFIRRTAGESGKIIGVKYAEAFRRIVIEGALVLAEGTRV